MSDLHLLCTRKRGNFSSTLSAACFSECLECPSSIRDAEGSNRMQDEDRMSLGAALLILAMLIASFGRLRLDSLWILSPM